MKEDTIKNCEETWVVLGKTMSWKKDSENFLVYLYHLNLSPVHSLGVIAWRNIAEELNEMYQANVTPHDCKEKILDLIFMANLEKKMEGVEILVKEAVFHNIVKERNVTRFSENPPSSTHIPLAAPNQSLEEREVDSSIVPIIIEEATKARDIFTHPPLTEQPSCASEIPTSIPSGDQNPTDFQLSVTKGFTEIISKIKQDIGNISEEQTKLDVHKNQVNLPNQEGSPRRFICVREGNEVPAVRDISNCEYLEQHNTNRAHLSEDALLSTVARDIEQMEVVSVRKFEEDHEAMEIDQSKFESDFESDSDSDLDSSSGSSSGSDSESESDLDESETESEPEVQVVEIQKKAIDLVDLTAEDDSEIGSDKDLRIATRDGGKKLVDKKKKVRWDPEYDAFLTDLRQSLLRTVNGKERLPNGSWDKIADAMNAQFKVNWITTERCQSRIRRLKALDSSSSQKRKRSSIDSQRKGKKEEKKRARLLERETGVSKGVPWTFRMDYYLMKFRRDLVVETGDLGPHGNLKMLEKMCEKFPDAAAKLSQKNIKSRTKFLKRKIYKDEIREGRYLRKGEWNMSHEKRLYEVMKQKYKGDNAGSESEEE